VEVSAIHELKLQYGTSLILVALDGDPPTRTELAQPDWLVISMVFSCVAKS
jgi:hypothetical protein